VGAEQSGIKNMQALYIGAIDIGGTKVTATVASARGPLARVTEPTVKSGASRALGDQVIALLRIASEKAGVDFKSIRSVGVSSCGPFAKMNGMLALKAPNICGGLADSTDLPNDWDVIPLEQILREQFEQVAIENDCVAALFAERTFGAVRDEPDCAYVTWSTGIGFGLCVDGRILHGKHGNAGHAGHMLMSEQSDALCGCGNRGDLEALISGRGLGLRFSKAVPDLFAAARSGEPAARAALAEAAQYFGRALYNLTAILDMRVFVIGGSIWNNHGEWLLPLVQPELERRLPALTQGVSIVPAALGSLVADVGALSLVMPPDWMPQWQASQPWELLAEE
jgi:glucokinase